MYADLSAVIDAANAALHPNGLVFTQDVTADANGVAVTTIIMHESGETLSSSPCWLPVSQKTPQGYGSAITYSRRYSLKARMGMKDEDDDGNAASVQSNKPPPPEGMGALKQKLAPQTKGEMVQALQQSIEQNRANVVVFSPDAVTRRPNGNSAPPVDPIFPNYGALKNQPIRGASIKDLTYYANGAKKTLEDPGKARFHAKERQLLAAIEAEMARQSGG